MEYLKGGIPFFKIERGSALALYGCGKHGTLCYDILKASGYYHIVCCVDQNYAGRTVDVQPVKPVDELRTAEYDYVLITICNEEIALQVKSLLIGMGIAQDKILMVWERAIPLTMEQLSDMEFMQAYLHRGFERLRGIATRVGEYYPELHESMAQYKEDRRTVSGYLKSLVHQLEDNENKIVVLQFLYEYGCFDTDCLRSLMKYMLDMNWRDDTCYDIIMNSSRMIHMYPALLYDDFFTDRIALQKKLCEYYGLYQLGPGAGREKKRIAVITWGIQTLRVDGDRRRAGNVALLYNYILEFLKRGYEVKVFDCWAGVTSDIRRRFLRTCGWFQPEHCVKMKEEFELLGIPFMIHWDSDIGTRLRENVRGIVEFQPSFILDMADEYLPEAYALIQWFPIVQLPMRTNNYSSAATLRIFGNKETVRRDNLVYQAVLDESVREVMLGALDQWEDDIPAFDREKYGFSQEDFLLVTVSGGLDLNIDANMTEAVCRMLGKYANMKWLLVGCTYEPENALLNRIASEKQIILWGYEDNLEGLYGMCDICLNPPRRGGGVSLRLAMKMGLPVATTDSPSGILNYMDPEQVVHGDCEALMAYVERLYQDPELYRRASESCRRRIADFSLSGDVDKILTVCHEAEQMFERGHGEGDENDTL